MIAKNSAGLYPWSKDLEASSDVRLKEHEGFAMLLGWLEKFVAGSGLPHGREACERFWKEQIRAKPREKWQLDQWGAAMRWPVSAALRRGKYFSLARSVASRMSCLSDS